MKRPTREFLEKRRGVIIADLLAKVEAEDWHGAADCCMDLREIDAQLPLVDSVLPSISEEHKHNFLYDIQTDDMVCSLCGVHVSPSFQGMK